MVKKTAEKKTRGPRGQARVVATRATGVPGGAGGSWRLLKLRRGGLVCLGCKAGWAHCDAETTGGRASSRGARRARPRPARCVCGMLRRIPPGRERCGVFFRYTTKPRTSF